MNLTKNPSQGIDLLDYRWVVRGALDLTPGMRPEREEYVKTRDELDTVVNELVGKGYCVHILPTYVVMENFDQFRSGLHI